jgi:large subunit ribosomal protein L18
MARTNPKLVAQKKRIKRIRKKISGSSEIPRLRVFKSNKHTYAQIIDDSSSHTLATASTMQKGIELDESNGKIGKAFEIGKMIAIAAKQKGIEKVVFDRGGNIYHGRVKAVSDGARKAGLIF